MYKIDKPFVKEFLGVDDVEFCFETAQKRSRTYSTDLTLPNTIIVFSPSMSNEESVKCLKRLLRKSDNHCRAKRNIRGKHSVITFEKVNA